MKTLEMSEYRRDPCIWRTTQWCLLVEKTKELQAVNYILSLYWHFMNLFISDSFCFYNMSLVKRISYYMSPWGWKQYSKYFLSHCLVLVHECGLEKGAAWWCCIAFLTNLVFPQARLFSSKNVKNKHLAQNDVWTCLDYSTDRSLYRYEAAPFQTQKNLDKCFTSRPITWMFHVLKKNLLPGLCYRC